MLKLFSLFMKIHNVVAFCLDSKADLARILPANARACNTSFCQSGSGPGLGITEGGSPNYLALIIQVRMVCHKGLFKGCLLVTDDENLCKPGCVVFRESMRKAQGAQRFQSDPAGRVQMDILSTFGTPQCRGAGTFFITLNFVNWY